MGIYIQTQGNKVLSIAGTEINKDMIDNGYFLYEGEIPNVNIEYLLYNEVDKKLSIDEDLYKQKLDSLILEARKQLEDLYKNFNDIFFGDLSIIEVASWDFKFKLANSLSLGQDLSEDEETYLQFANIKTKKQKKTWSDKVINKANKTRTIQGVADYIRTEGKTKLKTCNKHEEVNLVLEAVKIEYNEKLEELKKIFK